MEAEESRFIRKVAYKHACFKRKQEVGGARSKRAIPAHAFYFFSPEFLAREPATLIFSTGFKYPKVRHLADTCMYASVF